VEGRSRNEAVLGNPEDPFVQSRTNKQMHETLERLRGLSTGFKKDYLNTFSPSDAHLGALAINHSAAARRKARKFDRENPSMRAPTYDILQANTQQMMRKLDPDFDARLKERTTEYSRRRKLEEWIQEEPGVPPEASKGGRALKVFVEFLLFVNTNFCTDENDTWIVGGYEQCYKTLSFTGAPHLCSNEWNTNLAYLKFDAQPGEVFSLFRDIADDGIIPFHRFLELENMGSFVFDALSEGLAKAKERQQMRKMGFVPEKPRSMTKKTKELAEYGAFYERLQGAMARKSDYTLFNSDEQQKGFIAPAHLRASTFGDEQEELPEQRARQSMLT